MSEPPVLPVLQATSRTLGGYTHWMAIARPHFNAPGKISSCEEEVVQLTATLKTLQRSLADAAQPSHYCQKIYKVSLFVAECERAPYYLKAVQDFFNPGKTTERGRDSGNSSFQGKDNTPVLEIINQPPLSGEPFAVEAWGISCASPDLFQLVHRTDSITEVCFDGLTWSHCSNVRPKTKESLVYPRSLDVFKSIGESYSKVGIPFEDVIRVWIYLGDIVGAEGETQRYKELNRARTDYFADMRFCEKFRSPAYSGDAYPASTGIGSNGKEVMLSALSLESKRSDVIAVPLENPQQTSAFNYGQVYSPSSPKFARALGVQWGESGLIFISGTASITDAESRFIGDPIRQTECTLDNIACLIDRTNCRQHGFTRFGAELSDLAFARVYIKRAEDYPVIAQTCRQMCGDKVPLVFTLTDVCRPELLVEIEGVAFAK